VSELSVEQRDELAEAMDADAAPKLIYAVHVRDEGMTSGLLSGLDWHQLAALAVVLAARCPRPVMPGEEVTVPCEAHRLVSLLAAERVRRGITVPALARRLGYEPATVYGWEAGRKAPSLERLEDYANALGYLLAVQFTDTTARPGGDG
jgi:DNA-binding XRE family transcriptional regulator